MTKTRGELKVMIMASVGRAGSTLTNQDVEAAIDDAVEDVYTQMPYDIAPDETTVTLVSQTYEYDISSTSFALIYRITMADSDGDFPTENIIPNWMYTFQNSKLTLDNQLWYAVAGRKLRIEGQAHQVALTADDSILYISAPYVVAKAAATLLGNLGSPRETLALRKAEDALQKHNFRPRPGSKRVR